MIHNGIEYGLMQAYAEGFSVMQHKTEFAFDLHQVAEIWRHGSVVRSWLLDLTANALKTNPRLEGIAPYVADSGEGRWAVAEAIDLNVPAPAITLSLLARIASRDPDPSRQKCWRRCVISSAGTRSRSNDRRTTRPTLFAAYAGSALQASRARSAPRVAESSAPPDARSNSAASS